MTLWQYGLTLDDESRRVAGVDRGNTIRESKMSKGLNKRKEVKKPKKEVVKPGTVAVKNSVQTTNLKVKE